MGWTVGNISFLYLASPLIGKERKRKQHSTGSVGALLTLDSAFHVYNK